MPINSYLGEIQDTDTDEKLDVFIGVLRRLVYKVELSNRSTRGIAKKKLYNCMTGLA